MDSREGRNFHYSSFHLAATMTRAWRINTTHNNNKNTSQPTTATRFPISPKDLLYLSSLYITQLNSHSVTKSCRLEILGGRRTRRLQVAAATNPEVRVRDKTLGFRQVPYHYNCIQWVCSFCWFAQIRLGSRLWWGILGVFFASGGARFWRFC